MTVQLLKEPWTLLISDHNSLITLSEDGDNDFDLQANPVQLLFPHHTGPIQYGSRFGRLPAISPGFIWEGQHYRHYALPNVWSMPSQRKVSKKTLSFSWPTVGGLRKTAIKQLGVSDHDDNHLEELSAAKSNVERLLSYFHSLQEPGNFLCKQDTRFRGGVRVSWDTAVNVWSSEKDTLQQAMMSLIVRLSRDRTLHSIIELICTSPNETLKRVREKQKLSKVKELDTSCIRWLARRSGKTVYQKSMPYQQILAVKADSHYNNLENRVFSHVVFRLKKFALDFLQTYPNEKESSKSKYVGQFSRFLDDVTNLTWINGLDPLRDVVTPNNTLMYCYKYNYIWEIYKLIQKLDRQLDEAWEYQRSLWIDAGKQLIGCALEELSSKKNYIKNQASSSLYINQEQHDGRWLRNPCMPGPYKVAGSLLQLIDTCEVEDFSELAQIFGLLGTQQILCYENKQNERCHLYMWYPWILTDTDLANSCEKALRILDHGDYKGCRSNQTNGMILIGPALSEHPQVSVSKDGSVVQVRPGTSATKNHECIMTLLTGQISSWMRRKI